MAVRLGGQTPGDMGPPFRKRQIRHNASQGFREDAPFDVRTGHDVPLVISPDQVALLRVLEVRKDYLICEGVNPYTRKWMPRVAVAKPYLLQVTPFDGKSILLEDGSVVSFAYDPFAEDYNTRVVTTTDTNGNLVSEITETLSHQYFLQDADKTYTKDTISAIRTTVVSEDGSQAIDNTGLIERNNNGDPIDHEENVIPEAKGFPVEWLDLNTGARRWIGPSSAAGFFPVELLNSGGEAGDAEEQCSWKYHIRLPGGDSILLADEDIIAEPHVYRRPALGAMAKATAGMARYDNDDELIMYWTNEVPVVSTC